jgi:hypothetical protein
LIKLLNMTASQHDAEVLVAIRKSNALLRRNQTTWSERDFQTQPDDDDFGGFDFAQASEARGIWESRVRAEAFRTEVRAIPFWLRLLFFPLWAGAEIVATAVIPARNNVIRGGGVVAALMVFLLCSGIYLAAIVQIFMY